jgi:hypothetical protein
VRASRLSHFVLGVSLISVMGLATGAAAVVKSHSTNQATLRITNTTTSVTVGTPITLTTSGGSGSGAKTFSVTGSGCTVGRTSGVLTSSGAATCVAKVTKAASGNYKAATSAGKTFTFVADAPTPANPDVAALVSVTGAVNPAIFDYSTNGRTWFLDQFYLHQDHWGFFYVGTGSTVTLTYHVTGSNGAALENTLVTLETQFNGTPSTPYMLPNNLNLPPAWSASGMTANGNVTGTTDASGNVSFTLVNTNNMTQFNFILGSTTPAPNGLALATPADTTSADTADGMENTNPYSRLALVVGAATSANGSATDIITANPNSTVNQAIDLVDLILVPGN